MGRLTTEFAGLKLKNPFIVGSSGLTDTPSKNRRLEEAGAGAVVLKSLFEEQILRQTSALITPDDHTEANDYLEGYLRSEYLTRYIRLIEESKRACTIPVVASVNCYSGAEWTEFAHLLCLAGADAIELNVLSLPSGVDYQCGEFERRHVDILRSVKAVVSIPVIVKMGSNLTNPVQLVSRLYAEGAAGVVLFNRMYRPDIDIRTMRHTAADVFSYPGDIYQSLRWIAIGSAAVPLIGFAASGGVSDGESIVKLILAGASAVEVCSALYRGGAGVIRLMLDRAEGWMAQKGYESVDEFRGLLNASGIDALDAYERTQFLRYFEAHG